MDESKTSFVEEMSLNELVRLKLVEMGTGVGVSPS